MHYVAAVQNFKIKVRSPCINQRVLMAKLCFEKLDGMQWALTRLRRSVMCLSQRITGYVIPDQLV